MFIQARETTISSEGTLSRSIQTLDLLRNLLWSKPVAPRTELAGSFDEHTRTGAGGTGLGLAICRQIIQHHGGRIWAESEPSGQTRITFTIPRKPRDAGQKGGLNDSGCL